MSRGSITLLCGLPASGKSTWVSKNRPGSVVLCPDDYRLIVTGQDYHGPSEDLIWSHVKITARVLAGLQNKNVVIDATCITRWSRGQWISIANDIGVPIDCIVFNVSLEDCRKRNRNRARVVPDHILERMDFQFNTAKPSQAEGFSSVEEISNKWGD